MFSLRYTDSLPLFKYIPPSLLITLFSSLHFLCIYFFTSFTDGAVAGAPPPLSSFLSSICHFTVHNPQSFQLPKLSAYYVACPSSLCSTLFLFSISFISRFTPRLSRLTHMSCSINQPCTCFPCILPLLESSFFVHSLSLVGVQFAMSGRVWN